MSMKEGEAMQMGERIAILRKKKGLSQEELAAVIGVSRQSISKWESSQSVPDLDKIIQLCTYFDVSSDHLILGKESEDEKRHLNIKTIVLLVSAFNLCGLIFGCALWLEYMSYPAFVVGPLVMIISCVFYVWAMMNHKNQEDKIKAQRIFWYLNTWILLFYPFVVLTNILAFQPLIHFPFGYGFHYLYYWILYGILCFVAYSIIHHKLKKA